VTISCNLDGIAEGTAQIIIRGDSIHLPKIFKAPDTLEAYLTAALDDPYVPLTLELLAGGDSDDQTEAIEQQDVVGDGPEIGDIVKLPSPEPMKMVELLELYSDGITYQNFFLGQMVRTLTGPRCDGSIEFHRHTEDAYIATVKLGIKGSPPLFELNYEIPIEELMKVAKITDAT
jgi:hypothetical protein